MSIWVWRIRVVQSAGFLAGSLYYLSLNVAAHAGLIPGHEHVGGLSGCIYGSLGCSMAAVFHFSILCWLFKKRAAARARERQQQLPPIDLADDGLDMV